MTQSTNDPVDQNIQMVLERERRHREKETVLDTGARKIAEFSGTVKFAIINLIVFVVWIGFNLTPWAFDPYPFTFLTLTVSLESIFLSIFLLVSQNAADEQSEDRHHLDLQINLLAERETTDILRLLNMVAEKVGIPEAERAKTTELEEETDVEQVLDKIEHSKEE